MILQRTQKGGKKKNGMPKGHAVNSAAKTSALVLRLVLLFLVDDHDCRDRAADHDDRRNDDPDDKSDVGAVAVSAVGGTFEKSLVTSR